MAKINKGDKVAIISPSAQIESMEKIAPELDYLHSLGFTPVYGKHTFDKYRYMAGSDKDRAEDVNWAFNNPEIKAIFCTRAAAGASRILPYLDYEAIKNNAKPLIGFCDNGAIQLALNKKSNIISWSAFSGTYDFKEKTLPTLQKSSFEILLSGDPYTIKSGKTYRSGSSEGTLLCANLSTLIKLAGTKYFPDLSEKILLLEDINEKIYKIDLMLQQLKQQANFDKIKGIIFGTFIQCSGDEEDGTLENCFDDFLAGTNCPCINKFEYGHFPARYALPLGGKVKLNADNSSLEILQY